MKQVYLSGPISGLSFDEADDWRVAVGARLREVGIRPVSPLRAKEYLRQVSGPLSPTGIGYADLGVFSSARGITSRDRYDCTTADVVLVNLIGAKSVSIGTMIEIGWADAHRIPIVCAIEPDGNVHEHVILSELIGFRVESLDEAVDVTKAILL